MYIIQYNPLLTNYFSEPLHTMSIEKQLLNLFYYPTNYPFWFLRELMVIFLISPMIFILIKYLKRYFIILILVLFLMFDKLLFFNNINLLTTSPFFYFSLGAFLSLNRINIIFNFKGSFNFILIFIWLVINLVSVYNDKQNILLPDFVIVFDFIRNLLGCFAFWGMYDFLNERKQWINFKFYNYSFFIFAFHGIPVLLFVKLSMALFKDDSLSLFIAYIVVAPVTIISSILIGTWLKIIFPNLYKVLVGSRK
jgi:hypothetical protein